MSVITFNSSKANSFYLSTIIKLLVVFIIFTLSVQQTFSQNPPVEHQEMRLIGELPGHVDIGFMVVKCENSNANQVFLQVENESERYNNPNDVTTTFEIVILDYEKKESFTRSITISIKVGEKFIADCKNNGVLKFDLPASYDPKKIAAYLKPSDN